MHLLIPYAAAHSERGRQAIRRLKLPKLAKLLARLAPTRRAGDDENSLTPPHERAQAELMAWQGEDGCLPWAAYRAARDGVEVSSQCWAQLTPVHCHVDTDHVSLPDPALLRLSARESHELFEAVRPLFESEGWQTAWGAPLRWYVAHDSLEGLASASIDRAIGRGIERWLPTGPHAKTIRRLQNEVQMLLYRQPVNDVRAEQGALGVNSFWVSGVGRFQPGLNIEKLICVDTLRGPALNSDWNAWAEAWRALDDGAVQDALASVLRGEPTTLTLCGERTAQTFEPERGGWWAGLSRRLTPPAIAPVLETL